MQTDGGRYLMLIEASITAGIRPTSMILHTQPTKPWNKFDFLCIEAYQIVQNERCQQCGSPRWLCHNEDGDVGFKALPDTCFATREAEIVEERASSKTGYKAPKGTRLRTEAFRYSEKPIDLDLREAYYKAEYEKKNPESTPEVS